MSKLITQDLIASVDWLKDCPPNWKDSAYTDLKNKLGRVKTEIAPAALKGIKLEEALCKAINEKSYLKDNFKCSPKFKDLIEVCKDYQQQKKTKTYMIIDDIEYCLYGKIDFYKPELLLDLKATDNFKGQDKYLKSYQHKIYCYNEQIKDFEYVICEFQKDSTLIKDIYFVIYRVNDFNVLKQEIIEKIKSTINFLKMDDELFNLFNNVYSKY
jgi:hypothetical protein